MNHFRTVDAYLTRKSSHLQPDLSHHLTHEARTRVPNPMKDIWQRVDLLRPDSSDLVSLANGHPDDVFFPLRQMDFVVPSPVGSNPFAAWQSRTGPTQRFSLYKDDLPDDPDILPLNTAMQYHHTAGVPQVITVLAELTERLHSPSGNQIVALSSGSSDAYSKIFRILGERGDTFLTDKYGYPAATNSPLAFGVNWEGVPVDSSGIIPAEMEKILEKWDISSQGKKPHVLYVVPCGHNPTGSTLSYERRCQIYQICQKYDIIIIEDDPYYFLHYDVPPLPEDIVSEEYITRAASTYPRSFLSLDVDGRVIRLDTFSKVLAPGMRIGWMTGGPVFIEALNSYADSAMLMPHGFGQCYVTEMLGKNGWGQEGFLRWIRSLSLEYQRRRDVFLEVFEREVGKDFASVEKVEAGMFVWITVNIEAHPKFLRETNGETNMSLLMDEFFATLVDHGVVLMPASMFLISQFGVNPKCDKVNYLRGTFSGPEPQIVTGVTRLGIALKAFYV